MTTTPLDGARTKVARAEEHSELLGVEWQAFIDTNPYGIRLDFDPEEVAYTPTFQIFKPVPRRLLAIAGDFIHNLRSALDYVSAELVISHGGSERHAAFPIYIGEREFIQNVRFRDPRRPPGPLDRIPPTSDAWAFIERLQPYQRGHRAREDPLYSLNLLSNRDKHRMLNPGYGLPFGVDVLSMMAWNPLARCINVRAYWDRRMPLEDGTKLGWFQFDQRGAEPRMYVKNPLAIDIVFRGDDEEGSRSGFSAIHGHVAQIVRDAEVFFL